MWQPQGLLHMSIGRCLVVFVCLLGLGTAASAQNADDYRGGWTTGDAINGATRTYQFSIRGDVVRGIYCTFCSDATTLAFVDGKLAADSLTFTVTHVKADGSTTFVDHAVAKSQNGQLVVTGTLGGPGGGKFVWTMHKDARGPDPLPVPVSVLPARPPVPAIEFPGGGGGGRRGAPPAYLQPAPWKTLTPADVAGVWIGFGSGVNKQFFIVRRVGTALRGMVCGRCDNPYTMAALDDFTISGDTLTFNILHEDWGPGTLPFHNQVTAHIASNEMRIQTQQDNMPAPPARAGGGSSLMGPVSIESTAGNP
jgi:hypothetical protein